MEGFVVEIPDIEIPDIEIPDIEIPEIEIPETEIMEIEMAETEIPDVEFEMDGAENFEDISHKKARAPQSKGHRVVKVKVNDYIRCSVFTVTFFNFFFLGTAALKCSLKAINRKIRRDVAGAKWFGCCALTANIFAIIVTIVGIILIVVFLNYNECRVLFGRDQAKY